MPRLFGGRRDMTLAHGDELLESRPRHHAAWAAAEGDPV
jgi:hypothetical protein